MKNRPSAKTPWSIGQRIVVGIGFIAAGAAFASDAKSAYLGLQVILFLGFALVVAVKLISIISGLFLHDVEDATEREVKDLDEDELPIYTIQVPMYREPEMVAHMLAGLTALDYPKEKLDVQLLLEENDTETREVAASLNLPDWITVVVCSKGKPQTKPRACNIGLKLARGEFLVIFDAEDRPDPDQLKKAIAVFRREPKVACLQARLNYYNARQNLLTRWFTLEYTTWFDLFLPGLHSIGAPIPLGGTSNHFRIDKLRELGGWDAWNVTEDCDLGMEMAREGMETRVLGSTTWEEAVSSVPVWLRQRSRWVKGYWQTLLVQTRRPLRSILQFGPWKYLMMWLVVGGHVFALALQPFCWLLLIIGIVNGDSVFHPSAPHTLYLYIAAIILGSCNILFVLVHAIAAWQRRMAWLWPAALGLPAYWLLMSWAAWKGVLQHIWAPFHWEKTTHGLSKQSAEAVQAPELQSTQHSVAGRFVSLVIIIAALSLITLAAIQLPRAFNFQHKINLATLDTAPPVIEAEFAAEENWVNCDTVTFSMGLGRNTDPGVTAFKAVVHFKDGDGRWFQQETRDCVRNGDQVVVIADLKGDWQSLDPVAQPYGPWNLRRVKEAGIKLYAGGGKLSQVTLESHQPQAAKSLADLTASFIQVPANASHNQMLESRFTLSRIYKNPFDPRQIDLAMEFVGPDGAITRAIAFYFQDYDAHYQGKREVLTPKGTPEWRVRFTPRQAGSYTWRLVGDDHHGTRLQTDWQAFTVAPSDAKGFIRVDPHDHRFFSYENGDFFYPLGINLRSPTDDMQPYDRDYEIPSDKGGAKPMLEYLDKMADSNMNLARVWMAPWFGGIEWLKTIPGYHGIGQYNMRHARQLDWIMDRARLHGIVIDLALQNHGPFATTYDKQWYENPYNADHGGPLRDRRNVMTNKEAKRLFAQRFRYVAARWGADPAIFGWTTWIEVDAVRAHESRVRAWHKELLPILRGYDTGKHPISTMYAGNYGDEEMWALDVIDFTQIAAYSESDGPVDRFEEVAEYLEQFKKPAIIEEYGGSAVPNYVPLMSQHVHDGLWAGIMQPVAGAPYPWWWNLVFAKDLDRFFKTAGKFVGDADLRSKDWAYHNMKLQRQSGLEMRAVVRQSKDLTWAWVFEDEQTSLRPQGYRHRRMNWRGISRTHQERYRELVGGRYNPATDTAPRRYPRSFKNLEMSLEDLRPNTSYRIEFWETWGSDDVTAALAQTDTQGNLTIKLPDLTRDIAVRILPLSGHD